MDHSFQEWKQMPACKKFRLRILYINSLHTCDGVQRAVFPKAALSTAKVASPCNISTGQYLNPPRIVAALLSEEYVTQ
jgi:hypothetical protein